MTRRANRVLFSGVLTLFMAGAAIEPSARAQGLRTPWWAGDRRPVAVIALYNGSYYDDGEKADRWGLQECWRKGSRLPHARCGGLGGVAWLVSEIQRRYDLGYRRFMLSLPAGHEKYLERGIGFPSAQWHLLDTVGIEKLWGSTSVRQDFATLLGPWLDAHRDVQLLIYQGLRFNPTLPEPWKDRDMAGSIAPDLTPAFHRLVVQENTKHWLAVAPPFYGRTTSPIGFVFDNTGVDTTRDALVAVLNDPTLLGTGVRHYGGAHDRYIMKLLGTAQ